LVKHEAGVRLGDEVPVRHRLEIVVAGGLSAGRGGGRRMWRLTDVREDALNGNGVGNEGDDAYVAPQLGRPAGERRIAGPAAVRGRARLGRGGGRSAGQVVLPPFWQLSDGVDDCIRFHMTL
jgi:hypothetical protein